MKLENQQISGSFKFRGALNALLAASQKTLANGVITSSTGNHGAAIVTALNQLGISGTVYVPENVSPPKLEALRLLGADIEFHGLDTEATECHARKQAELNHKLFISPYNDPHVIGGQGTIALEITRQTDPVDTVLVPVGGGGLASGIGGYLKTLHPEVRIIGCQPAHSAVMAESVKAGKIIQLESLPTLADGTAGGIEPGAITFAVCRQCIDDFILVSEEDIAAAITWILEKTHMVVEGAAALPVAALLKERDRFAGQRAALIISGKKISIATLKEILCSG